MFIFLVSNAMRFRERVDSTIVHIPYRMTMIVSFDRFGNVRDSDAVWIFHDLHRRRGHPRDGGQITQ